MKKLYLVFMLFTVCFSADKQTVCASYETQNGWSKKYKIQGHFYDGFELNVATNSLKYSSIDKYMIIFWDKGEASVIKIKDIFFVGQTIANSIKGVDQNGIQWKIYNEYYCF